MGVLIQEYKSCFAIRTNKDDCGPEGKMYKNTKKAFNKRTKLNNTQTIKPITQNTNEQRRKTRCRSICAQPIVIGALERPRRRLRETMHSHRTIFENELRT
jgi:hypothetical protein